MATAPSTEPRHPIQVVVRRTGLTADILRAWERRYAAVTPVRTGTGRRLYSDADIERLSLLRRATDRGRSIGQVADLDSAALDALIKEDSALEVPARAPAPAHQILPPERLLADLLDAISRLDQRDVDRTLAQAAISLSRTASIDQLLVPLMHEIGDRWRAGTLRVAHEHLASAAVRSYMGDLTRSAGTGPDDPELVITTPAGQLHELGALAAAATAAAEGWRASYLGPNLPAGDIASAAIQTGARAVALSITYPAGDPEVAIELERLRTLLPADVPILIGGRSVASYQQVLRSIGALVLDDTAGLRKALEELRART